MSLAVETGSLHVFTRVNWAASSMIMEPSGSLWLLQCRWFRLMWKIHSGFSVSLIGSVQWLCTVSCFLPRLFLLPPFHIMEIFAYPVMVELSPAIMRYGLLIQVYCYVDVAPAATLLTGFFLSLSLFNTRDLLGYIISLL